MSFDDVAWAYGIAVAVTAVICFGVRWNLLRGPDRPDATTLDGERVAFLTGGPRRYAAAVLARQRTGGEPVDTDLRAASAEVRQRLLDDGWLVPHKRQVQVFFCGMALGYLAGGGLVVTVVFMEDKPVGRLAALAVSALILAVLAGFRSGRYRSVRRELRRLRDTVPHLRPAARPALVTYGPAAAALAVGLFGPAVMTSVDPEFAVIAAGVEVEEQEPGEGTASGCGGCGCGGCGG